MKRFCEYFSAEEKEYIYTVMHIRDDELDKFGETARRNITLVLGSQANEADNFCVLWGGYTNLSLKFSLGQKLYVYRYPGYNTEFLDRRCEAHANTIGSRLGLDKAFIHIEPEKGWKLSHFLPGARALDYHSSKDVNNALRIMRSLHRSGEKTLRDFSLWDEIVQMYKTIYTFGEKRFTDFEKLYEQISELASMTKEDNVPTVLTHGDCWKPNYLITANPEGGDDMSIIDWEFSGNTDPGFDVGTFICCSDYTYEQALDVIRRYFNNCASEKEFRHMVALTAISSYYWFTYSIYMLTRGIDFGDFIDLWHNNSVIFSNGALPYYT